MVKPRRHARGRAPADEDIDLADRLHSAAIRLLRSLRTTDAESGLSGPQISALSVIVFRGPIAIGALADAEQVRPPTITRLVQDLEQRGLVKRVAHTDARVQLIQATPTGARLLNEGRRRRVDTLARTLGELTPRERAAIGVAIDVMSRLELRREF